MNAVDDNWTPEIGETVLAWIGGNIIPLPATVQSIDHHADGLQMFRVWPWGSRKLISRLVIGDLIQLEVGPEPQSSQSIT